MIHARARNINQTLSDKKQEMSFAQGIKLKSSDILDDKHLSPGIINYLSNSGVHDFQRYHAGLRRFISNDDLTLNSGFVSGLSCISSEEPSSEDMIGRIWTGKWTNDSTGETTDKKVFSKVIHLVNPFEFMRRSHILSYVPSPDSHDRDRLRKHAISRYNQASVDATICYLLSRLGKLGLSPATIDYYETVCGIADKYYYRITDDFMTLRTKRWFWSYADDGSLLRVEGTDIPEELRSWVLKKPEESEIDSSDIDDYLGDDSPSSEEDEEEDEDLNLIVNRMAASLLSLDDCVVADIGEEVEEDEDSEVQVLHRSSESQGHRDDEDEDEDEEKMDEFESRGGEIYLRCKDIPVLICFQEAAEGTMDQLLTEVTDFESMDSDACGIFGLQECERQWSAWLFQVCAALSVFQRYANFCHNDLHTNNIVWVSTQDQFIYYKSQTGVLYKVPTYGKIFKLIDFGRATAEIGDVQLISSDYEEGEDAWGQYNWGPIKDSKFEEIAPNPSFDLCRLAVSLFETLYPGYDPDEDVNESPLANLLWSWLQDDEGKSIMFNEEDGEERFPGFDLYVHIGRHVHSAIPAKQFSAKPFNQFRWRGKVARSVPADLKLWPLFTESVTEDSADSIGVI